MASRQSRGKRCDGWNGGRAGGAGRVRAGHQAIPPAMALRYSGVPPGACRRACCRRRRAARSPAHAAGVLAATSVGGHTGVLPHLLTSLLVYAGC